VAAKDPALIHIGVVDSLVKDLSSGQQKILDSDLQGMVQEFTGLKSRILQGGDHDTAIKKLEAGAWHLGVMPGVEFAWAKAKDAKLQPLIVAGYEVKSIHAILVAKKESPFKGFIDLKGKNVNLLTRGKVHCRLFAERETQGNPKEFFAKLVPVGNSESALDDILLGTVEAAVVDNTAFELYKRVHPGRAGRLKVVVQSERFPPPVIAYRQGALSDELLNTFHKGMFKANDSERGREVMSTFGVAAFEEVPADYPEMLKAIAKAYPPPTK
jgi:ABC-type phosphate/phosphonate transport system substrate-binding protein